MYIQLVFEAVVVVVAAVVGVVLMLFLLQYILKKENVIVWHSEGVYIYDICIYI